jgi:hypothetical protein
MGTLGIKSHLATLARADLTSEALLDSLIEGVKAHMEGLDFEDDLTLARQPLAPGKFPPRGRVRRPALGLPLRRGPSVS